MSAYAIAELTEVRVGPEIRAYLEQIDATLAPFGGAFQVHGAEPDVREGELVGTLIVIAFPDLAAAEGWYASEAYQAILPLRTEHAEGWVALVDGVTAGHRAPEALA